MTDHETSRPARARRDARLTLDISLSPDYVGGTVRSEAGAATVFEGWLGLAHAVANAAGVGGATGGPELLGDNTRHARRRKLDQEPDPKRW